MRGPGPIIWPVMHTPADLLTFANSQMASFIVNSS
jgi:hypothetical protein